jgi:hypothetical protein
LTIEDEITLEQMHHVMKHDPEGARILEMFCGESLIDLDKTTLPNMDKDVKNELEQKI